MAALTMGQAPGRPGCRSWAEEPLTVAAAAAQEGEAVQAVAQLGGPMPGVRPDRPVSSPTWRAIGGIMWVIFDHLRPSGHIMPDHGGDRGAAWMVLAPHDHLHIKQIRSSVRHYGAVLNHRPWPGSVLQVPLPDGRFAYGPVYRDATVCFYRYATRLPGEPPLGLRDFAFCVGVYDDVVACWEVVGVDGFSPDEDNGWPPASGVKDPISGSWRIYHRGAMRAAAEDEARDLETAAVWGERHLLPRLAEVLSES